MTKINPAVFRQYDIRGVVEKDFPEDFVYELGRATATFANRHGTKKMTLGRDARLSRDFLHKHFSKGLVDGGIEIEDLGMVHTPAMYFSLFNRDVQGGVMITGSHNPPDQNGFKIAIGKSTIHGDEILELLEIMKKQDYVSGKGSIKEKPILNDYINYVANNIKMSKGVKPLKVVIDAGNGTAGLTAGPILKRLGCELTELYTVPDGRFPNHEADPTVVKNMQALIGKVKETDADIGIGYDGDGDRIGVVAPDGRIIWGDLLLLIFARDILKSVKGATFVSEVKCSQVMYDMIRKAGGNAIMWRTGHSLIKAKMKEVKAELAGEMSGHIFFAHRYFGYDDAVYSSARLVELLAREQKPITELLADVPTVYNTPEIRIDCPEEKKFKISEYAEKFFASEAKEIITVDGVRVIFKDGAWGLIRASNTQPVLVLRFEGPTEKRRDELKDLFLKKVAEWSK